MSDDTLKPPGDLSIAELAGIDRPRPLHEGIPRRREEPATSRPRLDVTRFSAAALLRAQGRH